MALTYYIRSWDPRSTYPENPQEGDICYTITLDQTWAPVAGVKKDNIVKEEIYQSGAWVEQGGGSSKTYYIPEQTAVVSLEKLDPLLTTTDEIYALSNGDEVTVSFNGTEAAATVTVNGLGGKMVEVEIGAYIVSIGLAADSSETTFLNVTDGNYDYVTGTYTVAMYTIEGGGGSSDFTTAKVTVNSEQQTSALFPFATSAQGMEYLSPISMISQGSSEFDVVLYKGTSMFMLANDVTAVEISSVSGDAQLMGPAALISGDCTINITGV